MEKRVRVPLQRFTAPRLERYSTISLTAMALALEHTILEPALSYYICGSLLESLQRLWLYMFMQVIIHVCEAVSVCACAVHVGACI